MVDQLLRARVGQLGGAGLTQAAHLPVVFCGRDGRREAESGAGVDDGVLKGGAEGGGDK